MNKTSHTRSDLANPDTRDIEELLRQVHDLAEQAKQFKLAKRWKRKPAQSG
jgi:hypothetical protein